MFYSRMSRTMVFILGLAALLVSGCGGGGDNSAERDLQEQVDMLEADLAAAQQVQATAEATQAAAEAAQAAAEVAQATAETERDAANTAKGVAEEMARVAQQAQMDAEAAQAEAEAAEAAAEAAQAELQAMLNQANVDVAIAEAVQSAAETAQAAAETAKTAAEQRATAAETAKARADAARTIAEAAETTAKMAQMEAEERAEAAEKRATESEEAERVARARLADALEDLGEAEQDAEDAEEERQRAQEQTNQRIQNQEANQRAQNLKDAFIKEGTDLGTVYGDNPGLVLSNFTSPVNISAQTRGRLTFIRGGHSTPTISSARGIRSVTMALTSGGDSGNTVVYTDRELTRPILDHYGQYKDPNAPQFRADVNADGTNLVPATALTDFTGGTVTPRTGVSFTHRLLSSLTSTTRTLDGKTVSDDSTEVDIQEPEGDRTLVMTDDSFAGRVHGVSGQFSCVNTGGDACMITATGAYHPYDSDNRTATENDLNTVTIAVSAGTLYFRPGSPTAPVSLCDDSAACTAGTDANYMVFGWWREDPTSAAAEYEVDIFAQVMGSTSTVPTATYDGTATGLYVEQDPNNAVDTHRQGEFTADVDLSADGSDVSGTIDDFVTTPKGGSAQPRTADRWVVTLESDKTALVKSLPGERSGRWDYALVSPHTTAATGSDAPAVAGVFSTRILNFLHLVGAFGAEKR